METLAESSAEVNCNPIPFNSLSNSPATLTCHQCQAVSIPAPEGATAETRYVCPQCSPLGPELEHFDRCQFDDAGHELPISKSDMSKVSAHGLTAIMKSSPPLRISRAIARGQKWAIAATPENIMNIRPRCHRDAFILMQIASLSAAEASTILGVTARCVNAYSTSAKKILINML